MSEEKVISPIGEDALQESGELTGTTEVEERLDNLDIATTQKMAEVIGMTATKEELGQIVETANAKALELGRPATGILFDVLVAIKTEKVPA